ncbi:MAG: cbb3-type cytochrome c oxidase subunit 3 [Pseudomonadota bacterium]
MDFYSLFREFADSWALLALFTFFVGAAVWVFRPGSRPLHDDAAQVPFRADTDEPRLVEPMGCANACPGCSCGQVPNFFGKEGAR